MPGHNSSVPNWSSSGVESVQNVTQEQQRRINSTTGRPDHSSNMQEIGFRNDQRMFRTADNQPPRILAPKDANSAPTSSFSHGYNQFQKDGNSSMLPGPRSSFMTKPGYGMSSSPVPFFQGNIRHHDNNGISHTHAGTPSGSSGDSKSFNSFQNSFGAHNTSDRTGPIPQQLCSQGPVRHQGISQPQFSSYSYGIRQHPRYTPLEKSVSLPTSLNVKSHLRPMAPSQAPCSNNCSSSDRTESSNNVLVHEALRNNSTNQGGKLRSNSRDSVFREPKHHDLGVKDSLSCEGIVPVISSVSTGSQSTPMKFSREPQENKESLEPRVRHGFVNTTCQEEILDSSTQRISPIDNDHCLSRDNDVNTNDPAQKEQNHSRGIKRKFHLKKLTVTIPSSQEIMESPNNHSPSQCKDSSSDGGKVTLNPSGLDSLWAKHLADLEEYKSIHGHCNVPFQYAPNKSLGYWVHNQRQVYKKWIKGEPCSLTESRVQSLIEAGFNLRSRRQENQGKREDVANFVTPVSSKSEDKLSNTLSLDPHTVEKKFEVTSENVSSGTNVISPADSFNSNSKAQSFKSDGFDVAWYRRLEELRDFKNKYGHSDVPSVFAENKPLGTWVMNQRQQYRKFKNGEKSSMNEERVASLNELGFRWYVGKGMRCKEVPKFEIESSPKRIINNNKTLLQQVKVGTKLAIYWDDDKSFYPALVQEVHKDENKRKSPTVFSVQYEDGQIEKLGLLDIPFKIISQPTDLREGEQTAGNLMNPFDLLDETLLEKVISYLQTPNNVTAFVSTSKRFLNLHLKSESCSPLRRDMSFKSRKPSWDLSASQFEGGIVTAAAALSNLAGKNADGLIYVRSPSIKINRMSKLQAIMSCDGDAFPSKEKKILRDNMRLSIVKAASEHAFHPKSQNLPDIPFWGADRQAYECIKKSFIAFSGMWSCAECIVEGKDAYCCRLQRKHDFNTIGKRLTNCAAVDSNHDNTNKNLLKKSLWECSSCSHLNDENKLKCQRCDHTKTIKCKILLKTNDRLDEVSSGYSSQSELSVSQHSSCKVPCQGWSCPYCSTTNYNSSKKCDVCNRSKDGEGKVPKVKPLTGNWKCYKCNETNLERNKRCRFCCAWKGGKRTLTFEAPQERKGKKGEECTGWVCNFCSFKNTGDIAICTMCHGSDRAAKQDRRSKYVQQLDDLDYKPSRIKKRKKVETIIQQDSYSGTEVEWECHKCSKINKPSSKRCKTCFSWKGGKRKNMAKRSRKK